jgi:hypothetical protein
MEGFSRGGVGVVQFIPQVTPVIPYSPCHQHAQKIGSKLADSYRAMDFTRRVIQEKLKLRVYLPFFQLVAVQACAYCLGVELYRIKCLVSEQSHNILRER